MMIDANIPIIFWDEMINTALYLQGRSPTTALGSRTPYKVLHQTIQATTKELGLTSGPESDQLRVLFIPTLNHLRRIGCVAILAPQTKNFRRRP